MSTLEIIKSDTQLKHITGSMLGAFIGLVVVLILSTQAMMAALSGNLVTGKIVEYKITKSNTQMIDPTQKAPKLHEILVEYRVNEQDYWVLVNSHIYSGLGLVNDGGEILVAYERDNPHSGFVLNYALFSTLCSILLPFIVLILTVVTPQWIWRFKKAKSDLGKREKRD